MFGECCPACASRPACGRASPQGHQSGRTAHADRCGSDARRVRGRWLAGVLGAAIGAASATAGREAAGKEGESAGVRLTVGGAFVEGVESAMYERLELDATGQMVDGNGRLDGPMWGLLVGLGFWTSDSEDFGVSLPSAMYLGARILLDDGSDDWPGTALFVDGALGVSWLVVDRVHDTTGAGVMAPLGLTHVGLDVGFVRLVGEGGAEYRWQWGARDRFVYLLGGAVGIQADL